MHAYHGNCVSDIISEQEMKIMPVSFKKYDLNQCCRRQLIGKGVPLRCSGRMLLFNFMQKPAGYSHKTASIRFPAYD